MKPLTHTIAGSGHSCPPVRSHPQLRRWRALCLVLLAGVLPVRGDLITRDYWTNITGTSVANLTNQATYPHSPSGSDFLLRLEATGWVGSTNVGGTNNLADDYGQRIYGYLQPTVAGDYTFWIRSDNHSELWLSTDSNPANKTRIAYLTGNVAQTDLGWNIQANQKSAVITLTTGRKYIEVIHKESTGGDHLAVGWLKPGEVGIIPSEIIPGNHLLPYGAPSLSAREAAGRFLTQATFGPTKASIDALVDMNNNYGLWITEQFALPVSSHLVPLLPMTNYWTTNLAGNNGSVLNYRERRKIWMDRAMTAPDQLRQRVGFALSEIFVISDASATLNGNPLGMADYYDRLLTNSFGNFTNLLMDVSTHPTMGVYLSHLRNQKANTSLGTFPDENYAREIMQLFSIGLWMLNTDGTEIAGTNGLPISTYDNGDITELARVFTGFNYPGSTTFSNGGNFLNMMAPMKMYEAYHDTNSKTFLFYNVNNPNNKQTIPGGVSGLTDVSNAVKVIVNHPNTGPFIARRLIQRLVTSNPTTEYVKRVASKFNDNGSGIRGDMQAVIRQLLTDTEARDVGYMMDPAHGKLRESFLLTLNLARAFNATPVTNGCYYFPTYWPHLHHAGSLDLGMTPQSSPSVFNFFKPDFQPEGEIRNRDLFAPEFEILSHATAHSIPNFISDMLDSGHSIDFSNRMTTALVGGRVTNRFVMNYATELALASNVNSLLDHLDELLTYGNLSTATRNAVSNAISLYGTTQADLTNRVKDAIYLISTSPDGFIQK